jgi:uncharacterized peroxidase-related enzyme
VPNYFRALGHAGPIVVGPGDLYTNAMFDDRGLPRVVQEQLAIVVSGLNVSTYCLPAHLEMLGRLGLDKAIGRKPAPNYPSAPVEPKVMDLFRFADKLTRSPGGMEKADVDRLREAGWSEAAIFDAVLVTSLYACANRFSAGLGLIADF